ncbi:MAG: hypothetical protein KKC37_12805, partial [Proteobacteria bacterium]|nr:hypothetical protein [Pseudomonadota bacterium]
EPGAVEFEGRLTDLYRCNLESRLAERIWWRLLDCRDRGSGHLASRLAELPWEALLGPGFDLEVSVTGPGLDQAARQRLAALVQKSYAALRGAGPGPTEAPPQRLLLRRAERRWRLGLDSSGERLHRRGYRLDAARAPLRETLGAAVLTLAGYGPLRPLWDPMCGSGTLLIEAAQVARDMAPGRGRAFAFQTWANFREATWRHLIKRAGDRVRPACPAPIVGLDRHPAAVRATQDNARRAGVAADLRVGRGDFFDLEPIGGPPGLVVVNPPYGQRLRLTKSPAGFYGLLGRHLRRCFPGWRAAVLVPALELAGALALGSAASHVLKSGGRRIFLVTADLDRD